MAKAVYSQEIKGVLDKLLLGIPMVRPGKMFGYPAYYVGGKMFACLYEDGVGLKVPEKTANDLLTNDDIVPFVPLGRKRMREWIQINRENSEEYAKDMQIFETAIAYVAGEGR